MATKTQGGLKWELIFSLLFILLNSFSSISVQSSPQSYEPTPENLKARQWFQDAKFGLFVHWGIYSILGDGEWVMNTQGIPVKTYEKLASFFYPVYYNPAEWVSLAKKAGMKYIVITSRHHDGFSMFDTKYSCLLYTSPSPRD